MGHMTETRSESFGSRNPKPPFEAIVERVLRAYHQDQCHGGAKGFGENILDAELVPVAREAFLQADNMPPDREILSVLESESLCLLGEGYHIIALGETGNRFVVKYVKHGKAIPLWHRRQSMPGRKTGRTITA